MIIICSMLIFCNTIGPGCLPAGFVDWNPFPTFFYQNNSSIRCICQEMINSLLIAARSCIMMSNVKCLFTNVAANIA